jgi:abortive infection bacteriophage resistance protein
MLKQLQPSMSIDDQIKNLKSIGLSIPDEEYARRFLNDVSYYRLIKGFSIGLKEKNGHYHDGVSFEQIVSLYIFNAKLRQLLFSKIEIIEINLRTRLSNHICENYGVLGYKNPSIMPSEEYHASLMNDVNREIKRNSRSPSYNVKLKIQYL